MRGLRRFAYALAFGLLAAMVAVNTWPVNRARSNGDPVSGALFPGRPDPVGWLVYPPMEEMQAAPGGGWLATRAVRGTGPEVLTRLDGILKARAERVGGRIEAGRVTWLVRSRLVGFPDLVTADVSALVEGEVRLTIWTRPALPLPDMGRNEAQLRYWFQRLSRPEA